MRALVEARTNYYLLHNTFTSNLDELDVEVPYNSKDGTYYYTDWGWFRLPNVVSDYYGGRVMFSVNNTNVRINFQYGHKESSWGAMNYGHCYAPVEDSIANEICSRLGKKQSIYDGDNIYIFKE